MMFDLFHEFKILPDDVLKMTVHQVKIIFDGERIRLKNKPDVHKNLLQFARDQMEGRM